LKTLTVRKDFLRLAVLAVTAHNTVVTQSYAGYHALRAPRAQRAAANAVLALPVGPNVVLAAPNARHVELSVEPNVVLVVPSVESNAGPNVVLAAQNARHVELNAEPNVVLVVPNVEHRRQPNILEASPSQPKV
jgi:hypothetical protein